MGHQGRESGTWITKEQEIARELAEGCVHHPAEDWKSGTVWLVTTGRGLVLVASGMWRPKMLLNVLDCTGQIW